MADIPAEQNPAKKLPATFDNAQEQQKCLQDDACKKLLEDASGAVYKILADNRSQGTGWTSNDGRMVTDYHVIAGAKQIFAEDQNGVRYRIGQTVSIDKDNDLAVLNFAEPPANLKPLRLATSPPTPGDTVYSLNHRAGKDLQMQIGTFEGRKSKEETERSIVGDIAFENSIKKISDNDPDSAKALTKILERKFDAAKISANHGSSGGPVFDRQGQVSSMVAEGGRVPGIVYNTPSDVIARGLTLAPTGKSYYQNSYAYLAYNASGRDLAYTSLYAGLGAVTGREIYRPTASGAAYLAAGTFLLNQTLKDGERYLGSGDSRDQVKYGLALAADSTMAVGLATRIAARSPYLGLSILAGGATMRLAADLIPNILVYKEKE